MTQVVRVLILCLVMASLVETRKTKGHKKHKDNSKKEESTDVICEKKKEGHLVTVKQGQSYVFETSEDIVKKVHCSAKYQLGEDCSSVSVFVRQASLGSSFCLSLKQGDQIIESICDDETEESEWGTYKNDFVLSLQGKNHKKKQGEQNVRITITCDQ